MSVIVPVYAQAALLGECLSALSRQTYPQDRFEVIVVDNGSPEGLGHSIASFPKTQVIRETRPGSYAARNRGVAEACGDVLAFTDADCLPDTNWIESGIKALDSHPETVAVGGRVSIFPRDSQRLTAVELHQSIHAFPQQRYVEQEHFAATANLFAYRRVFNTVGRFDERLLSSGDWEWGQRLFEQRLGQMIYAETVRVRHPAIRRYRDLAAKTRRLTGGWFQLSRQGKYAPMPHLLRGCLMAPWVQWMKCRSHPALRSGADRWRLLTIEWMVATVSASEFFRLAFGGQPRRQ